MELTGDDLAVVADALDELHYDVTDGEGEPWDLHPAGSPLRDRATYEATVTRLMKAVRLARDGVPPARLLADGPQGGGEDQ